MYSRKKRILRKKQCKKSLKKKSIGIRKPIFRLYSRKFIKYS